jgi:hypothetical protein
VGSDGGQWGTRSDVQFSTGDSLRFDGADDTVDCGNGASLSVTTAMTIEAWVKGDRKGVTGKGQILASKWEVQGAGFTNTTSWSTFDPGANGVGNDPDGMTSALFDGRYIYFVCENNGTTYCSEVVRYDTQGSFSSTSSWMTYDPGQNGVGSDPDGYWGMVFDGRYIYFAPYYNGSFRHGEVMRYDTQGTFNAVASWATYNPGNNGVGNNARGYFGAVFDGRYVYFVPYHHGTWTHGEVLRYDTQGTFASTSSWAAYDAGLNGVGTSPRGFIGGVYDGRYIYFVPHHRGPDYNGEVLRYDTQGAFSTTASWATYDAGANGLGNDLDGFRGGVFDGRYVYFVPNYNGTAASGEVMRYDTQASFTTLASWAAYDPSANGVGTNARGFISGMFDGRYVYFVPSGADEVLRYDTQGSFTTASSWATFDAVANGVGTNPDGYVAAVFDGRHIYFAPYHNTTGKHGEIMRYDTTGNASSYKLGYSCRGQDGFGSAPFGFSGLINTSAGAFSVHSNTDHAAGTWHHIALTYDGSTLSLYLDSTLVDSLPATGNICTSSAPFQLGSFSQGASYMDGFLDEVRVYNRALPANEILAHFERRKYANPEPVVNAPGAEETAP